jgi:hypothetical protein
MGTGVIMGGRAVPVPGFDVVNYLDDPRLRLAAGDRRLRSPGERAWVHLFVKHTTGGIPGGKDLRPQLVLPGLGPSTGGGDRVVDSWTHDVQRPGGAHLVVDQDGRAYCCADLLLEAAYHARAANGVSVGVEDVQGHARADLYQGQLDASAALVVALCRMMPVPVQLQVPARYAGGPSRRLVLSQQRSAPLADVVGIVGHRDLTSERGAGDPGDASMAALVAAGCEAFDLDAGEDRVIWRMRQEKLGIASPDGIPGPATVEAIRRSGRPSGIWRDLS